MQVAPYGEGEEKHPEASPLNSPNRAPENRSAGVVMTIRENTTYTPLSPTIARRAH